MKTKIQKIPLYFGELVIIFDKDWDEINKKYSHLWPEEMDKTAEACVFPVVKKNGCTQFVAAFVTIPSNKVLIHETVHLVNELFGARGIKLDLENDEPQAYLTGWFFEELEKFRDKIKKRGN